MGPVANLPFTRTLPAHRPHITHITVYSGV